MKPSLATIFTSFFLFCVINSIIAQNSIVGTWRVDSAYNYRLANGSIKPLIERMQNADKIFENPNLKNKMVQSLLDLYFIFDKQGVLLQQNQSFNSRFKYEIAKNGTILKIYTTNDEVFNNKILLLNENSLRIYFIQFKDTIQFTRVQDALVSTASTEQKEKPEKNKINAIPDAAHWYTFKVDDQFTVNFPVAPNTEMLYGEKNYKVTTADSATSFSVSANNSKQNSQEVNNGDTTSLRAFWEKSIPKRIFAMVSKQKGVTPISNQYLFFKNAPAFVYTFQVEENRRIFEYNQMNIALGNKIYVLTFTNEMNNENKKWKDVFFNSTKF